MQRSGLASGMHLLVAVAGARVPGALCTDHPSNPSYAGSTYRDVDAHTAPPKGDAAAAADEGGAHQQQTSSGRRQVRKGHRALES